MASRIIGQGTAAPILQQQEGIRALNVEQLRLVLQTIASRADAARQVLWYAAPDHGAPLVAAAEAAAMLLTSIGALADDASGATVIGDADYWNHGPDFGQAGEEAVHD